MGFIGDVLFGEGSKEAKPFRAQGFEQQGALLNQLLSGQALGLAPGLQGQFEGISPIQGQGSDLPNLQFGERSPFQFGPSTFDPAQAVTSTFDQQASNIENILGRRQAERNIGINTDLERRGLSTAGAAPEALARSATTTEDALSNALAGLAGTEATRNLQAQQFAAQQNQQREMNQAAEIFRQQGASDAQAIAMANQALQGQQLQQQFQQQPIENLLRLFQLSSGGTPGTPGSPGLVQSAAGGFGGGLGNMAGNKLF